MAEEGKTTLLFTGPLTDLARALDAEPAIEEKIETLFWMGGSLDGHGNVVDPCLSLIHISPVRRRVHGFPGEGFPRVDLGDG